MYRYMYRCTYNVAATIKMLCLPFIFVLHVAGAAEAAQKWSGSYYGGRTVAVCFMCSVEKFLIEMSGSSFQHEDVQSIHFPSHT